MQNVCVITIVDQQQKQGDTRWHQRSVAKTSRMLTTISPGQLADTAFPI